MTAYYNEINPHAAQWLRNLIAAGHIAPGDVDERSIEDVRERLHGLAGLAGNRGMKRSSHRRPVSTTVYRKP